MKAFLILEDGTVLTGESFGAAREVISEVVFNTSMTGYLEILTDPSYAGQSVVMTYPLIGNYGICMEDMESIHPWPKALIVRECAKLASNFRNEMTLDEFLKKYPEFTPGYLSPDSVLLKEGNIAHTEAFKEADEIITEVYETGHQEQAYIETQGMLAWEDDKGKMIVKGSMQCPYYVKGAVVKALGCADSQETEGAVLWFASNSGSAGGGGAGRRTSANCMVPVWSTM